MPAPAGLLVDETVVVQPVVQPVDDRRFWAGNAVVESPWVVRDRRRRLVRRHQEVVQGEQEEQTCDEQTYGDRVR